MYSCGCVFIFYFTEVCCELKTVGFGLTIIQQSFWLLQLSKNNYVLLRLHSLNLNSLSVWTWATACICACLFLNVSVSCLESLLALCYDQTSQDCGKEKSLQGLRNRFVLGCDALCWCNFRSALDMGATGTTLLSIMGSKSLHFYRYI